MKVKEITNYLEKLAPVSLQESYDNSGLIVGDPDQEVDQVLICLDSTEEVVDEAIRRNCQMIIAHHPIVFKGLKRFNGSTYVERVVMKAIRNNLAIYSIHTNLDNILWPGVNGKIAERLSLNNCRVLAPKTDRIYKLVVFSPLSHAEAIRNAMAEAGAGQLGDYDYCSFETEGKGRFRGNDQSKPYVGEKGEIHTEEEVKIEAIVPDHLRGAVSRAMLANHPYEEPAYDWFATSNTDSSVGSGLIGDLQQELPFMDFLEILKKQMNTEMIRYTKEGPDKVRKVALCGGSGSFLLPAAKRSGADVYITGDFKYHEFFDHEKQLHICDIGHYESEQFTIDLLGEIISKKFPTFAVLFTETKTNPVNYYY